MTKALTFRQIATDFPRYCISTGKDIIPTAIIELTKAATWAYPAPFSKRTPPSGNAIKLGISVIEPTMRERAVPKMPDSSPIKF